MKLWKKINVPLVVRIEGYLLFFEGLFMLSVMPVTYFHHGLNAFSMPLSALITLMMGFVLLFSTRKHKGEKTNEHDGVLIVCLSWPVLALFGGMPYLLGNVVPNFTDAFFESLSGFTTTGATVLTNIEKVPKDILFWRSMTQWIGGFAIVVFTVAILPYLSMGGMQLFVSEMNGITTDKLHPRIMHTARRIWFMYVFFTLLETMLLYLGDMGFYDALCHSMTTVCSGGFSTRNANLSAFSSYSQVVVMAFMLLSGCNFSLLLLSSTRKMFSIFKDQEFRSLVTHVCVFGTGIAIALILISKVQVGAAFRQAFFSVVSSLTTTGFFVVDYTAWPMFSWVVIFLLMFIGGCSGSTSGGVKMLRHLMFVKNSFMELKRLVHPNAILPVKINGKSVTKNVIYKNMTFIFVFFLVFLVGVMILRSLGIDFNTSLGAAVATLSNVGPGLGKVGPYGTYAFLPSVAKWVLAVFMLMGRVELFSLLTLLSRNYWKK